jgi:hypothetical protein
MATTQVNQKVFVSPGVYTSETDLSFVAQSVGVTTLGLVGETLRGPAFEPIFITNYDEFQAFFGGTEPTKFINTQIPKYEAAYIAKSYLQQSNQLFVTRILGLSGYDAGPSWSIRLNANVDPKTVGFSGTTTPFTVPFIINFPNIGNFIFSAPLPPIINNNLDKVYTLYDGSTSTLRQDFYNIINEICLGSTGATPILSATTAVYYGSVPNSEYLSITGSGYTATTISVGGSSNNVYGVDNVDFDNNDLELSTNDPWFYANFDDGNTNDYDGYSFYYRLTNVAIGNSPNEFTGNIVGKIFKLSGTGYYDYDNMIVATIRSRGISEYNSTHHGPTYEVPGAINNNQTYTGDDLKMICSGQYVTTKTNPFATFLLSGYTKDNDVFSFETNFNQSSSKYITKVLGIDNFGKSRTQVPIFVEEIYPGMLNYLYNQGYIRGLNCGLVALPDARSRNPQSIAWNLEQYQTPLTPFLVSELRGKEVFKLFRFISISDGTAANTEIKVSIANISFNNQTFDVLVRSFYDTDTNPVVLEKFTNCNMDIASNNFIAKKIGTLNGEFSLISKYIMVELAEDYPVDAVPCGFYGYTQRAYASSTNNPPIPVYKKEYNFPGQTIYDPPFGTALGGDNVVSSGGDNVRRTYLGFSTKLGVDESLLEYKGKQNPITNFDTATESTNWNYLTKGFHMDSGATYVLITNNYTTSGTQAFECGVASFNSEPESQENPYYNLYSRKFTVCFAGGFDGWDVYREYRTNQSRFQLGSSGYLAGAAPSTRYPTATGDGMFKKIVINQNTVDWANTDYYAYLLGIETFANPESTNINVFATGGIDLVNHDNLVENAINMVQYQRADSIYITTMPDYNMFTPDAGDSINNILPQEAVDNLNQTGIDSNYTATYYPWILVRDTVNNTQIYLPPTGEVCRNLALTDNIAFPWFASAGYTRGLVNSVKARTKLTQEDRDTLYQGRINPIATFSDVGTVIWGNKTLQVADSALNRLNVRRLLLQARKLISAVAVRLLFEQNDQIVRQQFLDSVNPILDAIRRDRGLYDFRVTVSSSPEDLDRNTLNGKIYLKPTRALEFINIEFLITPTGASFENI